MSCGDRHEFDVSAGQSECQEICRSTDNCVGISYTHKFDSDEYISLHLHSWCFVCRTDGLHPANNEYGFYRNPFRPKAPIVTVAPAISKCENMKSKSYCNRKRKSGGCRKWGIKHWACQATCGQCCADLYGETKCLRKLKQQPGGCQNNQRIMNNCRKTCGLCQ